MNIAKIIVMQDSIAVGVSLPKKIITKIDHDRGDISRSRYMLRLLERIYQSQESEQDQNIKKSSKVSLGSNQGLSLLLQSDYQPTKHPEELQDDRKS